MWNIDSSRVRWRAGGNYKGMTGIDQTRETENGPEALIAVMHQPGGTLPSEQRFVTFRGDCARFLRSLPALTCSDFALTLREWPHGQWSGLPGCA